MKTDETSADRSKKVTETEGKRKGGGAFEITSGIGFVGKEQKAKRG